MADLISLDQVGLRGEGFADGARRVGHVGTISVAPGASDSEVYTLIASSQVAGVQAAIDAANATLSGFVSSSATARDLAFHYANDNTDTDVPGGPVGSRGALFWLNQARTNGPQVVNALAQLGTSTKKVVFALQDSSGRSPLTVFDDGKTFLDLDPSSPAYKWVQAQVAAAGTGTVSGLNQIVGTPLAGSPATPLSPIFGLTDPNGRLPLAILSDGTLWIAKYDASIAAAVQSAVSPEVQPHVTTIANQIVAFYGSAQALLTSEGNNSSPRVYASRIGFLSDRFRGVLSPYVMNLDGSQQRAALRRATYDGFFITGQSLSIGYSTVAVTTAPPYAAQALMLSGGPVVADTATSSPTATLGPLSEATRETIATSFAAAMLDGEIAYRPTLTQVVFGHGYSGQAYSAIKQGTATYADVIAQATRIAALAATAGGKLLVRGFGVIHGETDAANASYEANLTEWQATYETDIRAAIGQAEPVYMFVAQTASIRYYYPTTLNAHKSALAQLSASVNNPKIVFVCPQYILPFQGDNLHITAAGERLLGEYYAKAYRKVVGEGRDWRGVSPKAFTLGTNTIDIQFNVPVGPLVLDTALCTNPGNFGFTYSDAASNTISSVALKGGTTDTVRITLSGAIGASAVIDYAYSNGTANMSGPTAGARGCLRDSDPALSRWDGTTHLYNPCAIFRQALN